MSKNDPFWTDDVRVLYNKDKVFNIFPNRRTSLNEQYNAFTRFVLIYGLLVSLYKNKSEYLLMAVFFCLAVSVYVKHKSNYFKNKSDEQIHIDVESFNVRPSCRRNTIDNPYGNLIFTSEDNHIDVCPDEYVNDVPDVPLDEWDVFGKNTPQRHFYRQPNVNIINDQTGYAKWLYGRE